MEAVKICGGRRMFIDMHSTADLAGDSLFCTYDA